MAILRSIGSSLIGKASPGAKYRDVQEQALAGQAAQQAEEAQVGSVARTSVEDPLTRATPEGSAKMVSSSPNLESGLPGQAPGDINLLPGGAQAQSLAGTPYVPPAPPPVLGLSPNAPTQSAPSQSGGGNQPARPQQQNAAPAAPVRPATPVAPARPAAPVKSVLGAATKAPITASKVGGRLIVQEPAKNKKGVLRSFA